MAARPPKRPVSTSASSSSPTSSSYSSPSLINIARVVFLASIAVLSSYLYSTFRTEINDYASFRSSKHVLSSISSVAFGEHESTSTVTVSSTSTSTATSSLTTAAPDNDATMTGVARIPNDIFQYSLLSALHRGLTSGGPPASHLKGYGTHGIGQVGGTLHDMLLLDGTAYSLSSGRATPISNDNLPFVMVTKYEPEYRHRLPSGSPLTLATLPNVFARSSGGGSGRNGYVPFSVYGKFKSVSVKGGEEMKEVKGTMFGIRSPSFAKEFSYPGTWCSFLSEDRTRGGKVEEFEAGEEGGLTVEWAVTGRYHLGFPHDPSYHDMDMES